MERKRQVLILSAAGFIIAVSLAVAFSGNFPVSANLIFLGMMMLIVPYAVYNFMEFRKIKLYEKEFPSLLRDLAESQRAGLTILQSIRIVSKSNYGSLTPHVEKMATQLSWNVPLESVLEGFTKGVGRSSVITRSVMIIRQASSSGTNVTQIMDALANNIEMLRDVENEKASLLNQQVMMLYAIFFIFVGISLALVKFLIPLVQTEISGGSLSVGGLSPTGLMGANPCQLCVGVSGPSCIGCNIFHTTSAAFQFGAPEDPSSYYKSLFFLMVVIQSIFSGLIAGQISTDSVSGGVKHSIIMFTVGVLVYLLTVRLGLV
ncbi:MAG: type II secretion system F family protein [Candidatus Aenigmarchaeota archaeon]|nr:type II secretion system F family protein [Candidatus Aenigmarchaeota archaeon]